jgi:putative ABC transport system permease protein
MIKEYFTMSWHNLRSRKLRSWLTMIGIFIGIGAVVALVAVSTGLQKSITEQFQQLGTDKLMIQVKGEFMPTKDSPTQMREKDVEAVLKTKGVVESVGMVFGAARIEFNDEIAYHLLIGLSEDAIGLMSEFGNWDIVSGRAIKDSDKNKVAVGYNYWTKGIFTKPVKLRDKIKINDEEYTIIGLYDKIGNPEDDAQIYISLDKTREVLGYTDEVQWILARTAAGADPLQVAESVKKELRKSRGLEKGKEDFTVQTFEEYIKSFETVLGIVEVILVGIAAISLLVGGIGIMNTMYTSVLQRTQEIGIMKSIGAKNSNIASLFLVESGMLGFFGGIIGIILGIGIGKAVEYAAALYGLSILKIYFPWYLVVGALTFSFLIGALSGLLPAIRASKLNPVESLRYE